MPTNSSGGWSMPEVSDPCDLEALAVVINDYCDWRRAGGDTGVRPLSSAGISRLIKLAFFASLEQEEGRILRFRLFAGSPQGGERVIFNPAVPIKPATIRRLAPSIPHIQHALWVRERGGGFESSGIVSVVEDRGVTPDCLFDSAFSGTKPGLLIRIMGPGHLRASLGQTWQWKAGTLKTIMPFTFISVVRGWENDLARVVLEPSDRAAIGASFLSGTVSNVWSAVIASVIDRGHGGAFVILPQPRISLLELKYPTTETSLLQRIKEFWGCFAPEKVDYGPGVPGTSWRIKAVDSARATAAEHRLRSAMQAIADLANVDGCVVLDRDLGVLGFGGKITVDDELVCNSKCYQGFFSKPSAIAKEKSQAKYELWNSPIEDHEQRITKEVDIKQFGTRHQSAFRLCAAVPGALAFVISQDRRLSVFYGEATERVWLWQSLEACARQIETA